MISQIDPITRLELLKEYIERRIDRWPKHTVDFDLWLHNHRAKYIPGTPEHAREIATHCYYCGRKFKDQAKFAATIDHWIPLSKGWTERYVICCGNCNNYKGNATPKEFIKRITNAELKGLSIFGYHGKTLKKLFVAVHEISNNITYNIGPRVFYIKK